MKRLRSRGLGRAALAVLLPTLLLVSAAYPPAFAQDATPAAQPIDLTGVAPQSLTGERRAKFEAYVADALLRFGYRAPRSPLSKGETSFTSMASGSELSAARNQ